MTYVLTMSGDSELQLRSSPAPEAQYPPCGAGCNDNFSNVSVRSPRDVLHSWIIAVASLHKQFCLLCLIGSLDGVVRLLVVCVALGWFMLDQSVVCTALARSHSGREVSGFRLSARKVVVGACVSLILRVAS